MSAQPHDPTPATGRDPLGLLDAVRRVAEVALPGEPTRVTQRVFDRARARVPGCEDLPPARRIAEQLGLPWRELVALAFKPARVRRHTLANVQSAGIQQWLTHEHIAFVLRLVARRLRVDTLTPDRYRRERARILAGQRRGRSSGQLRLPTEHQLATAAGSWDRALELAGLRPRPAAGGTAHRVAHHAPAGILDVLDRCYEHYGVEPRFSDLETFAKANGIPFPRKQRGRPWSSYVEEWKARRRVGGVPVPDGPPPKGRGPDYSHDVGAARPHERRKTKAWDDPDELADWVARYLRDLPAGETPSERGYDDWVAEHPGAPWSSVLIRSGGWSKTLAAARTTPPRLSANRRAAQ